MSGKGCEKCGRVSAAKKITYTKEEFIRRAILRHGDRYDYSLANYICYKYKVTIICKLCQRKFEQMPRDHLSGCGCTFCVNKTETKVMEYLENTYKDIKISSQFSPSWCFNEETNAYCRYDMVLHFPEKNIILEIDGRQHFQDVKHWNSSVEENRKQDIFKMLLASEHGYYIVRIFQEEIWDDAYSWRKVLTETINMCRKENIVCYISHKDKSLYDKHIEDIEKTFVLQNIKIDTE